MNGLVIPHIQNLKQSVLFKTPSDVLYLYQGEVCAN